MTEFTPSVSRNAALPTPHPDVLDSIRSTNIQTLLSQVAFVVLLTRSVCDPLFELFGMDLGGSTITFGAVVNALVLAIVVLFIVERSSSIPFKVFGIWAPYLLIVFGATLYAPQPMAAGRLALVILSYWAMFALPFLMFRSSADIARFILVILASSIVPSLYALWDIGHGLYNLNDFRLRSTFTHANIYAFYLVLLIGMALYVRTSPSTLWPGRARALITAYIPILIIFLLLTKTRSAWGACGLMFVVYAVRFDRRFLFGLAVLPVLLLSFSPFSDRLTDLAGGEQIESFKELNDSNPMDSLTWRQVLWRSALPSIVEKPILGHGLETFRRSTPEFFPLVDVDGTDAHNLYLQIVFEMGAVGLLAYFWLLVSLAWWIKSGLHYDPKGMVVVFTILAVYVVVSYTDNLIFYLAFNWYFMFAMGTICAWIEYQAARHKMNRVAGAKRIAS